MDMWVYLAVTAAVGAAELLLYLIRPFWAVPALTRLLGSIGAITLGFATGGLLVSSWNVLLSLIAIASLYRVVNLLRLTEHRMNSHHLRQVTRRSGIILLVLQLVIFALYMLLRNVTIGADVWLTLLSVLAAAISALLLASTVRRMRRIQFRQSEFTVSTSNLPTVTIAIPARNETESLAQCLRSVVMSDYPKLEVLVLDDCSQTRKTPEIIRSFAHDGVRFLKGRPPAENWLAKNQAYSQLAEAANGDILLFCGADIRFEPSTVRKLVNELMVRKKRMLCIVPMRANWVVEPQRSLTQAARYFWELAPPRRLFNRPPVLSSCWLIYKDDLNLRGGFAAVARMVLPEAYFARQAIANDGYSFLSADLSVGLTSTKTYQAQRQTAIRTRYPQLHRRPENVFFYTVSAFICLIMPILTLLAAVVGLAPGAAGLCAAFTFICLTASYTVIARRTRINGAQFALIGFLPAIITDLAWMHVSMYKYEFSEVIWKGRNVCVPVMHVTPSLPTPEPHPTLT